jgi:phage baseplate assembly protein gpV
MSVVSAGAGKAKGLVMLPDVGDRVLLLFLNGDPARGVVLGGLFSGKEVADSGVVSGAVRRYLLSTAGGQKVQIDDAANRIRLENNGGSCVDLSPEEVLISAKTKLRIEAIDQPVTIRGRSIDFERT